MVILASPRLTYTVLITALGQRANWATLHQSVFIAWAVLTGLHLLGVGRIVPALQLTVLASNTTTTIDGGKSRAAVLVGSVVKAGGSPVATTRAYPLDTEGIGPRGKPPVVSEQPRAPHQRGRTGRLISLDVRHFR